MSARLYLGIHHGHDATATLLQGDQVVAVIAEERLSRQKHQPGLPRRAIHEVLRLGGARPRDVFALAFSGRATMVHLAGEVITAPGGPLLPYQPGLRARLRKRVAMAVKGSEDWAAMLRDDGFAPERVLFVEHHLAHAASAFYASRYERALCITVDGYGDGVSATVGVGEGENLSRLYSCPQRSSVGSFYQAATEALGFAPIEGENKTMGLACFGDPDRHYAALKDWVWCDADGLLQTREPWAYRKLVVYGATYDGIAQAAQLARLAPDETGRRDLAAGTQRVFEEVMLAFIAKARERAGAQDLPICAAGGVMLNVKLNKLVHQRLGVRDFFVFPDAGDGGTALGAALCARRLIEGQAHLGRPPSPYLGNAFEPAEIEEALRSHDGRLAWSRLDRPEDFLDRVVALLEQGLVVGWFQGRMEMGPRALGARSVIADPRNPTVKERINKHLKKRDWFVPFAPSGLDERLGDFLVDYRSEPYMTKAFDVRPEQRGRVPAITHVDGTARPQGVVREANPLYYDLLKRAEARWDVPIVLNTSFNRHGLPIVGSPADAIQHLVDNNVEALAIGPFLVVTRDAQAGLGRQGSR
jgi:carbamoyltransferase